MFIFLTKLREHKHETEALADANSVTGHTWICCLQTWITKGGTN